MWNFCLRLLAVRVIIQTLPTHADDVTKTQTNFHSFKTIIHYFGRVNVITTQPSPNILQMPTYPIIITIITIIITKCDFWIKFAWCSFRDIGGISHHCKRILQYWNMFEIYVLWIVYYAICVSANWTLFSVWCSLKTAQTSTQSKCKKMCF